MFHPLVSRLSRKRNKCGDNSFSQIYYLCSLVSGVGPAPLMDTRIDQRSPLFLVFFWLSLPLRNHQFLPLLLHTLVLSRLIFRLKDSLSFPCHWNIQRCRFHLPAKTKAQLILHSSFFFSSSVGTRKGFGPTPVVDKNREGWLFLVQLLLRFSFQQLILNQLSRQELLLLCWEWDRKTVRTGNIGLYFKTCSSSYLVLLLVLSSFSSDIQ